MHIAPYVYLADDEPLETFTRSLSAAISKLDKEERKRIAGITFTLEGLSVHIDDYFDWIVDYYNENSGDEEKIDKLKTLIKTVDPLGYLMTRGVAGFKAVGEFFRLFPECRNQVASHNSCLVGDLGLAVQAICARKID